MKDKFDRQKNQPARRGGGNEVFLDARTIVAAQTSPLSTKVGKGNKELLGHNHKKFLIKISDLLNETGKSDVITFENKSVEQFPNLTKEGISGSFTIQSVNDTSLLGTLNDIRCKLQDTCDSCGTNFTRDIHIPEYTARFVLEDSITPEEKDAAEEAILFIDPSGETIDLQDMITQAIVLNEPFVKRCPTCEKKMEKEDDDEEDLGTFESKGNINFS